MKLTTKLAVAILQSLNELPAGRTVPEGFIYAALMGIADLDTYYTVMGGLAKAGWVKRSGSHQVCLTEAGRALVAKTEVAS